MSNCQCPVCGHVFDPARDLAWAELVRRTRQIRRIPLRLVAEHLGLSAVYVSDIERGQRNTPRYEIKQMWEAYVGVVEGIPHA